MGNKLGFLDRVKVQNKFYFIFFVTVFLPVITVGSYLVYHTRSLLTSHYQEQVRLDASRIRSLMLDLTASVYKQADRISSDVKLNGLLCSKDARYGEGEFRIKEHEVFAPLLTENGSVQYISLYTFNTNLPEGKYIHQITEEVKGEEWYQKAASSVSSFWSEEQYTDDFGNDMSALCLHTRIFLPEIEEFAILNLTVNNNQIKNRVESRGFQSILWLNGRMFYRSDKNLPQPRISDYIFEGQKEYSGVVTMGGRKAVGCISSLENTQYDDIFYIASMDDDGISYMNRLTVFYCLILVLEILVAGIFIYVFSLYFSKRVNMLRTGMRNACEGNYVITDSFQGTDEFSDVFSDMNQMIRIILHKEESIYRAQLQTRELTAKHWQMQFKMLSSQINSHFLYNTLETIRMRAVRAGNMEVANAIKLLGKSMRYVLENTMTSYTTLKKELDYIEMYLAIQKLRFHDRINYSLRVQPDISIENYPMLPLLLQPIVENAAIHGLEEVEECGKIIIHISAKEELLHIDIFDNGSGMAPGKLEEMERMVFHRPEDTTRSIGLHNIYQRIQLCYGKEYGFTIRSRPNIGTLVRVTLPLQVPGKEDRR